MIDCCIDSFENCFSLRLGNGFVYWYGTILYACVFFQRARNLARRKRDDILYISVKSLPPLSQSLDLVVYLYFSKLDFGIIFFYGKKQVLHVPRLKADYGFCASVDEAVLLCIGSTIHRQYVLENVRSLFLLKLTQYTSYIIYQRASEYIFFFFNNFR